MIKIGVLALQGAVREHIRHIELSGYEGIAIKRVEQLDEMFGTCAGLIVLAKNVENESGYLNKLDITVERNSFGRQVDSFESELDIKGIANDIEGVFIRAPHIAKVDNGVEILSKVGGKIVAVKQGQYLGVSFHPELTDDYRITKYFIEHMIKH